MGSRAVLFTSSIGGSVWKRQIFNFNLNRKSTSFGFSTTTTRSSLGPTDVSRLAETARISLTPTEAQEFAPKIGQVIDWFGQVQDVDLDSVEPAIRADTEDYNLRDDIPEIFENSGAMIAAVPSYEKPYIRVPKVLNKE